MSVSKIRRTQGEQFFAYDTCNSRLTTACLQFLMPYEVAKAARVSKVFRDGAKINTAYEAHLLNLGMITLYFWKYSSHYQNNNTQKLLEGWRKRVDEKYKPEIPNKNPSSFDNTWVKSWFKIEQFRAIAPIVRDATPKDVETLLGEDSSAQSIFAQLFCTCRAKSKNLFERSVLQHVSRPQLDLSEISITLLNHGIIPKEFDTKVWELLTRLPADHSYRVLESLLVHPGFQVSPDLLHRVLTGSGPFFYTGDVIPVKCLALVHEKRGLKAHPAQTDDRSKLCENHKLRSTFELGMQKYEHPEVLPYIKLMLQMGALPTVYVLEEFLRTNAPKGRVPDIYGRKREIITKEVALECVDLLLSKMKHEDLRSFSLNETFVYGKEMVEKFHKLGVRIKGEHHFCLIFIKDFSLEMAKLILQYGGKPTIKTWGFIANQKDVKDDTYLLKQFQELLFPEGLPDGAEQEVLRQKPPAWMFR